jgi:hypothetical protein
MGFMDKAKQLAEQAQQKLDEAQKQFNQGQSEGSQGSEAVRYDQHGRPIEGPPAGATEPPSAEPVKPATGDSNANPDPFKPIQ